MPTSTGRCMAPANEGASGKNLCSLPLPPKAWFELQETGVTSFLFSNTPPGQLSAALADHVSGTIGPSTAGVRDHVIWAFITAGTPTVFRPARKRSSARNGWDGHVGKLFERS